MMRFPHLAFLGALSMTAAVAAACSTTTETNSSTTTGSGGHAGTGGATTSSSTSTTTSTTTTTTASTGTGIGDPSNVYPAPHDPPPQVSDYGGPVLASPKIVPVYFSNDDATFTAQIQDFVSKVGATKYWTANTQEYGVGAATATAAVALTETATGTIDDSAIQTWLAAKLNGNDPAFPAADDNTVYALHYPSGVTITSQSQQGTAKSCEEFGGYHSNITLDAAHGSQNVAYAVIPRCGNFDGILGIDAVTAAESHELLEASTDPFPMITPAYASVDDAHFFWALALGGGETGDMCAQQDGAFTKFSELGYVVQRTWSNVSALAGHDPCVPNLPNEVYFNAAPHLPDTISIDMGGQSVVFKGVKIAVGKSKTIDIDLFSDGDTGGPWQVDVKDYIALMGGSSNLDLSLDETSGQNGQKLHLTIGVNKANQYNAEIIYVTSTLGQQQNAWVGIIGN